MEPIRHTKSARLGPLKMYREDLDQLLEYFQKGCTVVRLSDKQNRYDSLDEMKKMIGSKVKELDIEGEKPGLHFLLNHSEPMLGSPGSKNVFNELRTEEISDDADILFFKVREFLTERQRRRVRVPLGFLAIVGFAASCFFVSRNYEVPAHGEPIIHGSLGLLVSVLVTIGSMIGALNVSNYLTLDTKLASPSFWIKHKDEFASHAVIAGMSTLIGGLIGWLIGHYLK